MQWVNNDLDDHTIVSDDAFNTAGPRGVDVLPVRTDPKVALRASTFLVQRESVGGLHLFFRREDPSLGKTGEYYSKLAEKLLRTRK